MVTGVQAGEMPSQHLPDVRLPGTGRPVEDQLRAITQQIGTPGQPVEIHMQRVRQLLVRIHDGEFRCRNKQFVVGIFDLHLVGIAGCVTTVFGNSMPSASSCRKVYSIPSLRSPRRKLPRLHRLSTEKALPRIQARQAP